MSREMKPHFSNPYGDTSKKTSYFARKGWKVGDTIYPAEQKRKWYEPRKWGIVTNVCPNGKEVSISWIYNYEAFRALLIANEMSKANTKGCKRCI